MLAATTFTSGLRGVTLGSVFKDALIFFTVIVVIVTGYTYYGGFANTMVTYGTAKNAIDPLA